METDRLRNLKFEVLADDVVQRVEKPQPMSVGRELAFTARKLSVFVVFWSIFSSIWTEYGQIRSTSPYSVRMPENADQKNSEYGHFSRSES